MEQGSYMAPDEWGRFSLNPDHVAYFADYRIRYFYDKLIPIK